MTNAGETGCPAGRILGIDFGQKTIGVAVSDEMAMFARALATVPRPDWETEIPALAAAHRVRLIVVGYPKSMDNRENEQTRLVDRFIDRLGQLADCPVTRWDERLTTRLAERYLLAADLSRRRRRRVVDRLAAQVLLQDYLDHGRKDESFLPEREKEEI